MAYALAYSNDAHVAGPVIARRCHQSSNHCSASGFLPACIAGQEHLLWHPSCHSLWCVALAAMCVHPEPSSRLRWRRPGYHLVLWYKRGCCNVCQSLGPLRSIADRVVYSGTRSIWCMAQKDCNGTWHSSIHSIYPPRGSLRRCQPLCIAPTACGMRWDYRILWCILSLRPYVHVYI